MFKGEDFSHIKVAFVHDELVRRGGAEVVLEELIRIFPQADVYALYAGRPFISVDGLTKPIQTSFLQNSPLWFRRHPSRLLPLLPQAAEQFDFSAYDVVISSASGFAKSIITRSHVPHICYCHTPTRYLWDSSHEIIARTSRLKRWATSLALHRLRLIDYAGAQRVDRWLTNSRFTQQRIRTYYRQASRVIYPPIDTQFFTPAPSSGSQINKFTSPTIRQASPFLFVGRLTASKRPLIALEVCRKLKLPLTIIGLGPEKKKLERLMYPGLRFLHRLSREELRVQYRQARALLQPAVEDFGMAAAEALACGTPLIARNEGGVREMAVSGQHGILFEGDGVEALAEGVRQFLQAEETFDPRALQRQALPFAREHFVKGVKDAVAQALNIQNT